MTIAISCDVSLIIILLHKIFVLKIYFSRLAISVLYKNFLLRTKIWSHTVCNMCGRNLPDVSALVLGLMCTYQVNLSYLCHLYNIIIIVASSVAILLVFMFSKNCC